METKPTVQGVRLNPQKRTNRARSGQNLDLQGLDGKTGRICSYHKVECFDFEGMLFGEGKPILMQNQKRQNNLADRAKRRA